jgi:hypothetical protein
MTTSRAAGASLSPWDYARLTGRSRSMMPTALGKSAGECSPAEIRRLEAWYLEAAELFRRLEASARAGVDSQLSSYERATLDLHLSLHRPLWRWALGIEESHTMPLLKQRGRRAGEPLN